AQAPSVTNLVAAASKAPPTNVTNKWWRPPPVGIDGADWIQLISGEWLRGELKYVQDKKVEFDSDELKDLTLDLKDVTQIYPFKPMYTKFERGEQLFGTVSLSNNLVRVTGPEQAELSRAQLTGITPGGKREINFWSGKLSINANYQSGNTKQANLGT